MSNIALVDDDHNILTSVSIALEADGHRIMTYSDGASALESFKTSPRISPFLTSRCHAWTEWSFCSVCVRSRTCL